VGSRIIAVVSQNDFELSEEDILAIANERISASDRARGGEIDVLDLTSFSIKDCSEITTKITGINLHQEWIPPDQVQQLYRALKNYDPKKQPQAFEDLNCSPYDILELTKFVKACSQRKLGLYNPPWDY
jgi:hypothetical protein